MFSLACLFMLSSWRTNLVRHDRDDNYAHILPFFIIHKETPDNLLEGQLHDLIRLPISNDDYNHVIILQ